MSPGRQTLLATLVIFGWLGACWYRAPAPQSIWFYDAPVYLSIAYDIEHEGRFTDGTQWATPNVDATRPSGMIRSPLDPMFLAAAAEIDPVFNRTLNCIVETGIAPSCPERAPLPRALQLLMIAAVYLISWRIVFRATGSLRVAWLSLAAALFTGPILIHYAQTLMTETLCLFFTTIATLAGIEVVKSDKPVRWALLAGLTVGLATLTRPNFLYFLPAVSIFAIPFIIRHPQKRRAITTLGAYLIAGTLVITPWVIRNAIVFGQPALTSNYAVLALTQRVAYNEMNWKQFAAFTSCSLPDGVGMTKSLFGPTACDKFGYEIRPNTFYGIGSTTILHSKFVTAGGTGYVLYHYILRHPIRHAFICIPMAMRGLEIDHYCGFILGIFCIPLTIRAVRKLDPAILIITLPGWFMLAFYAALSADQTRFNLMLIIPFSLTAGTLLERLVKTFSTKSSQL